LRRLPTAGARGYSEAMLQFYFLSILANILAGAALASEYLAGRFTVFVPFRELLSRRAWQASLGVLAAAVGFLKLLIRSSAADVPVVGDLIPALLGMAMGASLLLHVVREKSDLPPMGRLERAALAYRVPLGFTGIVVAILHFLLPGALFL
jgi:hypothetical protein